MKSGPEETLAWQIRAAHLHMPAREFQFAKPRRWRFDFAWLAEMVAVEVEGGIWIAGRHSRGRGFEADCEKYLAALVAGWKVLRVTPAMVEDGRALDALTRVLGNESA